MGEFVSDITGRNDSVQVSLDGRLSCRCYDVCSCADSAGACMDGIIRHEPLPHQEMVMVTLQVASSFFPLVFYFEEQSSKQHRQPWVPAAECFLWGVQKCVSWLMGLCRALPPIFFPLKIRTPGSTLGSISSLLQSNSRNVISESNEDDLNRVDVLHRSE
ncbi:hypothetical protein OIU74_013265 [Salix koriyanagi]|uniref:Uncharacterized protein n=1 Tax=Salix koriyanagi TaxID=2511006 RepID=A0A9Q0Q8Q8_9ROSI|nr:hypothetical protein OIU74_013265 [Salix koriyanagi]